MGIEGALVTFKDEKHCKEFKHSIYSNDTFFNRAFQKFVIKSLPMIDPQIDRKDHTENISLNWFESISLKIFTVTTKSGKWHFGVEEATEFLFWCQAFHKYRSLKITKHKGLHRMFSADDAKYECSENMQEPKVRERAHSNPPRMNMEDMMDLNPLNDDDEESRKRRLSREIVMAVNLEKKSSERNVVRTKPFHKSQSLKLTPFSEKELIEDITKKESSDDETKVEQLSDDYMDNMVSYTDESEESAKDCLEQTITEQHDDGHRLRKHTAASTNYMDYDEHY